MVSKDALFFRWFSIMAILSVALYSGQILVGIFAVVAISVSLFPVYVGKTLNFLIQSTIFLLQSIIIVSSLSITVLAGFPILIANLLSAITELIMYKFESFIESSEED